MGTKGIFAVVGAGLMFVFAPGSAQATFPGENGPIVFQSVGQDLNSSIYVVRPDGSGLKSLTSPAAGESDYRPVFSPDAKKIAYTHDGVNSPAPGINRTQIHLMNADGTGDVRLTNEVRGTDGASFSPDGTKIVFSQAGNGFDSISTINVDGTGYNQLFTDSFAVYPAYSPDGSKIAFSDKNGLTLMDADGSNLQVIATDGSQVSVGRPSFSPDGSRIAFYSFGSQFGQTLLEPGIHSVKLDGTDRVVEVPYNPPVQPQTPSYSPDGRLLGYVNNEFDVTEGITILDMAAGTSSLVPVDPPRIEQIDWGVYSRTCEADPAFCPPPPPPECKMRFARPRFFVFGRKPAYRLVAKYYSEDPGEVQIKFFSRTKAGGKGSSLGKLSKVLSGYGTRFRVTKRVSRKRIKRIRRLKNGFIADFRIVPEEGFCPVSASFELTKRTVVKNHFVWFLNDF